MGVVEIVFDIIDHNCLFNALLLCSTSLNRFMSKINENSPSVFPALMQDTLLHNFRFLFKVGYHVGFSRTCAVFPQDLEM